MTDVSGKLHFSSRLMRKGVAVEGTYRCLAGWDLSRSLADNIRRIRTDNPIGAASIGKLSEFTKTLSNRFSHGDPIAPLATLARGGLSIETWKYCYLWHLGSTDGMFFSLLRDFLIPHISRGALIFKTIDVTSWLKELVAAGAFRQKLSDHSLNQLGSDLLRAAGEFGFLSGSVRRQVTHAIIPEDAVLYAIYSLWEQQHSVERLLASDRWAMFLMLAPNVERELMNLHQFRRVRYERAGSVAELHLPYPSLTAYAESLVP